MSFVIFKDESFEALSFPLSSKAEILNHFISRWGVNKNEIKIERTSHGNYQISFWGLYFNAIKK